MIYLICDTHLGHENIKQYCNRPDNFEQLIEANWQQTVTDYDTVIHLGDIALNRSNGDALVAKLGGWKGRKILVRGNHDKQSDEFYMAHGFTLVVADLTLSTKRVCICRCRLSTWDINRSPSMISSLPRSKTSSSVESSRRLKSSCNWDRMQSASRTIETSMTASVERFSLGRGNGSKNATRSSTARPTSIKCNAIGCGGSRSDILRIRFQRESCSTRVAHFSIAIDGG